MDSFNIKLDAQEILTASNQAVTALSALQAKFSELASATPQGQLKAQVQGILTEASAVTDAAMKLFGEVGRAAAKAQTDAKAAGKKIGQALADGLEADSDKVTSIVREQVRALQAEYEKLIVEGKKLASLDLQSYKARGVSLTPDHRIELQALQESQRASSNVLATSRRIDDANLADLQRIANDTLRARQNWRKATEQEEKQALAEAQRIANDTLRSRQNWNKATEQEAKRAQDEEQRQANDTFRSRQNFARATDREQSRALADLQRQSNETLRSRQNWRKATEQEEQQALVDAQRIANETFRSRQNWNKATEQEAKRAQAEAQRDANETFRLRQNFARATQSQNLSAVAGTAQSQFNSALTAAQGPFSSIVRGKTYGDLVDPAEVEKQKALAAALKETTERRKQQRLAALQEAESEKANAERLRELRSAFRGVAAAAGGLFLTYGSLIPLAAAFAAAMAVRTGLETFTDLEHRLQLTRAISEDFTQTLGEMRAGITKVSSDLGVMPTEAAKGMQVLSQAGLSATDALSALPSVLRLASVGEMDVKQATETATGALNAFGLGVDSIGRVSDVFVKAAAVSNASVSSIAESMKQASGIAGEFKVSVEDVGTMLAALAKRNIVGGAAGTAVRNLFAELASPKGESKKIADQLGITLFDPLKHTANDFFGTFLPDLRKKLEVFNPQSQSYILHSLFNERGEKAMSAMLGMAPADLAKLRTDVNDSAGYALKVFVEAQQTIQGEMDRLKATFSGSMDQGGSAAAEQVRSMLASLREAVGSDDFQSGLRGALKMVADLSAVLGGLASAALSPFGAIAALSAIGAASVAVRTEALAAQPALLGYTRAFMGLETGAAGAGVAVVGFEAAMMTLLRFSAITAAILGTVWALSKLYDQLNQPAPIDKIRGEYNSLADGSKKYLEQLNKEIQALREKHALQSGETGQIAEVLRSNQLIAESNRKLYSAQADANNPDLPVMFRRQRSKDAKQLLEENNKLKEQGAASLQRLNEVREAGKILREEQAKGDPTSTGLAAGKQNFVPPKGPASANSEYTEERRQQELAAAARRQEFEKDEEAERHREAMLKDSYERGTTTYGAYEQALLQMQNDASARRRGALQEELQQQQLGVDALQEAFSKAKAAGSKAVLQKASNDIEQAQQKVTKLRGDIQKEDDRDEERRSDALTKSLKPATEIVRNADKEAALQKLNVDQELEKLAVKRNGATLSEKEAYIQGEILRMSNAQSDTLKKDQATYAQMLSDGAFDNMENPEVFTTLVNLLTKIENTKKGLADTAERTRAVADAAFDAKKVDDFAKSLNTGLVDAIMNAGKDGGRGLRDTLEEELLRKPFKMVLQAILQPVTNGIAQMVMGGANSMLGGGAGSNLLGTLGSAVGSSLGLGSIGTSIQSALMPAGGVLDSAAGLLGMGSGLGGAAASAAEAASTASATSAMLAEAGASSAEALAAGEALGGSMAAGSGMLAAMGPVGWAALAAVAAYSLFGGKGGGPKTESGFGSGVPLRGNPEAAQSYVEALKQQYKTTVAGLHGTDEGLDLGFFTAQDPKGDAKTQLAVHANLGGKQLYDRGSRLGGIENVGRSDEELQAAIAEETSRVMLEALQKSEIPGAIGQYLKQLGDIDAMSKATLDKVLAKVQKAMGERQGLEDLLFDLTHNDTEKIARARERELAALDETNLALAQRVYALQDEARAKQLATDATDKAMTQLGAQAGQARKLAQATLDQFKPIFDETDKAVKSLLGQDTTTSAAAGMAFIQNALTGTRAGTAPNADALSTAIDAATQGVNTDNFGSQFEYDRARLNLAGNLAELRDFAAPQVDAAQKQLDDLDKTLEYWQEQLDLQRGTLDANLSVAQAVQNLSAALASEKTVFDAPSVANTPLIDALTTAVTDPVTAAVTASGTSAPETLAEMKARLLAGGFARGGDHDGGWTMVGEEGPELAYLPPARIYNTAQTQGILSSNGGADNETALMRQDLRMGQAQMMMVFSDIYKMFKRWDQDGMPDVRVETV